MSFIALKYILIFTFFCILLSGIFVPVYIDEISIKLLNARFFLDSAEKYSLYPQCSNTAGVMLSWVFYPAAIILSLIFQYLEPFGIRVSGIFFAIAWFTLIAFWCYRQTAENWLTRYSILLALSSLGVLPYLWVLSRSEQLLNLPILILTLLALYLPINVSRLRSILILVIVVFLISIFFYAHPKSLFFSPLMFVLVWKITKPMAPSIKWCVVFYFIFIVLQVFFDASLISKCVDAPIVRDLLKSYTLPIDLLVVHPYVFIDLAFNNIINLPSRMSNHLIFNPTFQSGWLPPIEVTWTVKLLNDIMYYVFSIFVVLTHLSAVFLFAYLFLKREARLSIVLAALIAIANIANSAFYVNQSFYDGLQYIACSVLILCLFLEFRVSVFENYYVSKFCKSLFLILILVSIFSMFSLLYLFIFELGVNSKYEGSKIPGQNSSVPLFGTDKHLDSIRELGEACNIPEKGAVSVVVDQMTYFAHVNNHSPVHILFTATDYFGADLKGEKFVSFLNGINSPGIIARCDFFPKLFDQYKLHNDLGYCCVDLDIVKYE